MNIIACKKLFLTAIMLGFAMLIVPKANVSLAQSSDCKDEDLKLLYVVDGADKSDIYTVSYSGSDATNLTKSDRYNLQPSWSPDGSKIAFVSGSRDGTRNIYVMNADGSEVQNLTNDKSSNATPIWSPDGTQIAFVTNRDGNNEIYVLT